MALTPPTLAELEAMLTNDAVALRVACLGALTRWQLVQQLGGEAAFLAPPYSLSAAEAEALFRSFNYAATPALVYAGQLAHGDPPEAFNFDEALALARRGA